MTSNNNPNRPITPDTPSPATERPVEQWMRAAAYGIWNRECDEAELNGPEEIVIQNMAAIIARHHAAHAPSADGRGLREALSEAIDKALEHHATLDRSELGSHIYLHVALAVAPFVAPAPTQATPIAIAEREGIYLTALERIAGNDAGTNFEEADGIAISAIERARALLTPPPAGTEEKV